MLRTLVKVPARAMRGILAAIRAKPKVFLAVAMGMFFLSLLLPPIFLSLVRKPWSHYSFNPWLKRLPEWLASGEVPLRRKLEFLPNLALFWILAEGPGGATEWGFTVDVSDVARIIFTSLVFGTYFALVFYRRDRRRRWGGGAPASGPAGAAGAMTGALGLSTGPCHVVGCGAPVLPALGLAFVGLSSGTLRFLMGLSKIATAVLLVAVTLGALYLGWVVGDAARDPTLLDSERTSS